VNDGRTPKKGNLMRMGKPHDQKGVLPSWPRPRRRRYLEPGWI
jgi:hypothetical protein